VRSPVHRVTIPAVDSRQPLRPLPRALCWVSLPTDGWYVVSVNAGRPHVDSGPHDTYEDAVAAAAHVDGRDVHIVKRTTRA
jgi:hypothetical protein